MQLKAPFPNAHHQLWPGTFVNVELAVRAVKNGLSVPIDVVQQGAGGEFVYFVGDGEKAYPRPVTVAQRHGAWRWSAPA